MYDIYRKWSLVKKKMAARIRVSFRRTNISAGDPAASLAIIVKAKWIGILAKDAILVTVGSALNLQHSNPQHNAGVEYASIFKPGPPSRTDFLDMKENWVGNQIVTLSPNGSLSWTFEGS